MSTSDLNLMGYRPCNAPTKQSGVTTDEEVPSCYTQTQIPKRENGKRPKPSCKSWSMYPSNGGYHGYHGRLPSCPAPARTSLDVLNGSSDARMSVMRFNCQSCVRKKIKCNRTVPKCASCSKAKLQCVYQPPPPPRRRKRSRGKENVHDRLARYERILHDHNLLPTSNH